MKIKKLLEQINLGIEMGYLTEESEVFFGIPGSDGCNVEVTSTAMPPLILKDRPDKRGLICFTNEMPLPKIDIHNVSVKGITSHL